MNGDVRLSIAEKKELLFAARETIKQYLANKKIPRIDPANPRLSQLRCGVFVTLKENGQLRGCIGIFESNETLLVNVQKMAKEAATGDPRFSPVTAKELEALEIDISVLYPLIKIDDVREIQVGRDGIYIISGFYRGVLLPQVATEYGWDRDTFLSHTCLKAGLPPDAWKKENVTIYRFEADVFSENE